MNNQEIRAEYSLRDLTIALEILGTIKARGGPGRGSYGICHQLSAGLSMNKASSLVADLAEDWEHYSGHREFPVPGLCRGFEEAQQAYMAAPTNCMWDRDHPYGRKRWQLVEYMIDRLAQIMAEY